MQCEHSVRVRKQNQQRETFARLRHITAYSLSTTMHENPKGCGGSCLPPQESVTSDTSRKSDQALQLAGMGQRWAELGGGHSCEYRAFAWSTGDTRVKQIGKAHVLWKGGFDNAPPTAAQERSWQSNVFPLEGDGLGMAAKEYWQGRQEGQYAQLPGVHVGTDGSSRGSGESGSMGAAMVSLTEPSKCVATLRAELEGSTSGGSECDPATQDSPGHEAASDTQEEEESVAGREHQEEAKAADITIFACKVGGRASSFRAEAAAVWLALSTLDKDIVLNIYTDSMNVVDTLQKWQRREFLADMRHQKNADIIMPLLEALNERTKETHVIKIKSHRGVELNELADREAGDVGNNEEAPYHFTDIPELDGMRFTWEEQAWDKELKCMGPVQREAITTAAVQS